MSSICESNAYRIVITANRMIRTAVAQAVRPALRNYQEVVADGARAATLQLRKCKPSILSMYLIVAASMGPQRP
jgi:hypothetical protein